MKTTFISFVLAIALLSSSRAADPASSEAKLREQLRAVMLQQRTLQAERDTLQGAKLQLEQEKAAAATQLEAATKQLAADKDASDKLAAELRERTTQQGAELGQLRESLEKWKVAQKQTTDLAQKTEGKRGQLAQEKIELERVIADQRTKNLAMHRIALEILGRYENFGLGTAIAGREPFTGAMRVKLENLVQDYADKVGEQRIKPAEQRTKATEKRP